MHYALCKIFLILAVPDLELTKNQCIRMDMYYEHFNCTLFTTLFVTLHCPFVHFSLHFFTTLCYGFGATLLFFYTFERFFTEMFCYTLWHFWCNTFSYTFLLHFGTFLYTFLLHFWSAFSLCFCATLCYTFGATLLDYTLLHFWYAFLLCTLFTTLCYTFGTTTLICYILHTLLVHFLRHFLQHFCTFVLHILYSIRNTIDTLFHISKLHNSLFQVDTDCEISTGLWVYIWPLCQIQCFAD